MMCYMKKLHDEFVEILACRLHYFEMAEGKDLTGLSYGELLEMQEGWRERYLNDAIFHNKVLSIVIGLLEVTDRETRRSKDGGG